jgi:hypothetical protein
MLQQHQRKLWGGKRRPAHPACRVTSPHPPPPRAHLACGWQEVERLKVALDGLLLTVDEWKEKAPSEEEMHKMEWDSKGVDELLTQVLLRLDNIEGADRDQRRACLRKIEGLQDGGVIIVREAVKVYRGQAAN